MKKSSVLILFGLAFVAASAFAKSELQAAVSILIGNMYIIASWLVDDDK